MKSHNSSLIIAVLEFIGVAGVITNGAVIAFTGEFVDRAVYIYDNGDLVGFVNITHPPSPINASCQ